MPEAEAVARLERLGDIFAEELAERVQVLNALLLQIERAADPEAAYALGELSRELHTLKGAARAVGASSIEQVAHVAEDAVSQLPPGRRPDRAWLNAVFAGVSALPGLLQNPELDVAALIKPAAAQPSPTAPVAALPPMPAPAPAPTPAAASAPPTSPVQDASGSVRVAITKLDTLLTESGELAVTHQRVAQRLSDLRDLQRRLERWQRDWRKGRPVRARLRRGHIQTTTRDIESLLRHADRADEELQTLQQRVGELLSTFNQNTAQLGAVATAISQDVMAVRLLPAGTIFGPLERLVRDLGRQTGKDARLQINGADTEVDRRILDQLRDPLMHMTRNAVDHGLEAADERLAAGKPAHGTLTLSAEQRGDRVQIRVEDDGRGLDVDIVRATAVRRGMLTAERAAQLDSAAVIDLIFQPGFSTSTSVSEISGRGVGMDVLREHVNRLGGDIDVHTSLGAGTRFIITVPLTLATTRVLLVRQAEQTFAVPSSSVERTGRVRAVDLARLEGRRAVQVDGRPVPVIELSDILQIQRSPTEAEPGPDEWRPFFVLPQGERAVAVLTDQLVDEQELVVKSLGAPLSRVKHVGGASVLGTGHVVVILNPSDLIKTALGSLESSVTARPRFAANVDDAETPEAPKRRVLVVDDSVMTRTLERSILESAGYEVVIATDGAHALEVLQSTSVDVVVSDVEMPRMDGLQLTAAIRKDERLSNLPVILVTSLDSPEHVASGAAAGANAYIVKGRFDQNELLETVGRLV